jgi:hypothetical protein
MREGEEWELLQSLLRLEDDGNPYTENGLKNMWRETEEIKDFMN